MATAIPENVTETYRKDARLAGTILSKEEREALVKPYLPAAAKASKRKIKPVRSFIKSQIHLLVFNVIHVLFSVYARFRQFFNVVLYRISSILYYHHRTPELIQKDVKGLSRLPKHLSVILELAPDGSRSDGLDTLLDEVAEISAWCASVGIPLLSVYERTGVLKNYIPTTHRTVAAKLHAYFGKRRPSLQVRSPHLPSFLNGDVSEEEPNSTDLGKTVPTSSTHATDHTQGISLYCCSAQKTDARLLSTSPRRSQKCPSVISWLPETSPQNSSMPKSAKV
jgi:dehydrodolichyl diphosphate syntase complex subunit NUS1